MDSIHVRRAHLMLLVKQTMYPGRLLATEVAPVSLHSQYLASSCYVEAGLGSLMAF